MWLFVSIPAIFAIFGALVYSLAPATKPKLVEFGHVTMAVGLFWLCWSLTAHYFPAVAAHRIG
jgi:hypothetical protein